MNPTYFTEMTNAQAIKELAKMGIVFTPAK